MPVKRTRAEAEAEYDAVRAAYLRALNGQSYSVSAGGSSRSLARQDIATLREQMIALEQEIARFDRGGIRVRGATIAES